MKNDLATARPWKRGYQDNQVIYSDYKQIAVIQCREKGWQDNAELIVRAVNNFDALLEACKNIIASADAIGRDGIFAQEFKQIRQAIANAEK